MAKKDIHVIKKKGHIEVFEDKKIFTAVYESCLNAHLSKEKANGIAKKVTNELKKRIKGREVRSDFLFKNVIEILKKHDKDAAFLYETHRDVS